jgi:hypothetical protein
VGKDLVFTLIVHNVDSDTLLLLLMKDLASQAIEEIEVGLHQGGDIKTLIERFNGI